MKKITTEQLKQLWVDFYESKGHKTLPSAPLVPENDATVLFTTAGMHPLVPFLLGEKHPAGTRLISCQKCFRTNDIDEVGDSSHCTFFEMLGNWSLGEYFKKDAIAWSHEFLTNEKWLGIDQDHLAVSVFAGEGEIPRDDESAQIWESLGMPKDKIFFLPKRNNWWDLGSGIGPCGPDTEMFFITDKAPCSETCSPACDCGRYLEIWNDVFMQYNVSEVGKKPELLKQKNVDTGMGVERTVCVLNNVQSVYDTGSFNEAINYMEKISNKKRDDSFFIKDFRIIADHVRASVMLISDGVIPSNSQQGYILRRLIRRALNCMRRLDIVNTEFMAIASVFIESFKGAYPILESSKISILKTIEDEVHKFSLTLIQGAREFEKLTFSSDLKKISGQNAFRLLDTFGFPIELTIEMAREKNLSVDITGFNECFEKHKQLSRLGGEQLFKGGLSDTSNKTIFMHTATHLMLAGLRKLLGENTFQRGSNITPERIRFDFNCERKLTPDELKFIETFVNDAINSKIDVVMEQMSLQEAKKSNALGIFESKYGDTVKVYTIAGISREICGGPHAQNTSDLVKFKILKEESSSAGIRRIKAVLEGVQS